jgi:hypothetical protein
MPAAVGFVLFLAIALIGVRVVSPRIRTVWPLIAGYIAFAFVTVWTILT